MKESSDQELVDSIVKDGSMGAFGELYERYVKLVYNKCLSFFNEREKAEDLTQDVFLKIYEKLALYDRGSLPGWIITLTYNSCVDKARKNTRYREVSIGDTEVLAYDDEEISEKKTLELRIERLRVLMERIDPFDKSLLLLKYQQGLKVNQIAELTEMGESAVKMRLSRARHQLLQLHESTDWV